MADAIVIHPFLERYLLCVRLMRKGSRVDTCQARGSGCRFSLACVKSSRLASRKGNGQAHGAHGYKAEMAARNGRLGRSLGKAGSFSAFLDPGWECASCRGSGPCPCVPGRLWLPLLFVA